MDILYYNEIQELTHIALHFLREIEHFFQIYKPGCRNHCPHKDREGTLHLDYLSPYGLQ